MRRIFADYREIKKVVNNLIANAVKYTSNNQIEIELEEMDKDILFSIKNGIENYSEENIKKIWQPFYVMESSRNKELSGTGLGLSIVKVVLERHGFKYGYRIRNNEIIFYIYFEKSPH